MSEYRSKIWVKRLSIIVSASIIVTITIEVVINNFVEKYFFGSILIPVVVIWIIIWLIEFLTREDREDKNRLKAAKVIQVDTDSTEVVLEET
ncbi:MAG TPA: hypothetical protein VMZ29_16740 [Candidatus Bathyarchaeia archaeon]|nr:hypothetical protein [Candidatus Bathyarchaeia archaeon]